MLAIKLPEEWKLEKRGAVVVTGGGDTPDPISGHYCVLWSTVEEGARDRWWDTEGERRGTWLQQLCAQRIHTKDGKKKEKKRKRVYVCSRKKLESSRMHRGTECEFRS